MHNYQLVLGSQQFSLLCVFLDDKYACAMEANEVTSERRLDPPGAAVKADVRPRTAGPALGKRDKDKHRDRKSDRPRATSPKRVDFQERLNFREMNSDGTYTDGACVDGESRVTDNGRPETYDTAQSTLTDSRAIRETEIRFLNNNLTNHNLEEDVRWGVSGGINSVDTQNRLTRVNVTVPGSTRPTSSSAKASVASTHSQPVTLNSAGNHANDVDHKWETLSTDSGQSDDIGPSRRIKKTLKDFDSGL